jgi:hypothetical protein
MHAVKTRARSHPERQATQKYLLSLLEHVSALKIEIFLPHHRGEKRREKLFLVIHFIAHFSSRRRGRNLGGIYEFMCPQKTLEQSSWSGEDDVSKQHGTEKKFRKYQR